MIGKSNPNDGMVGESKSYIISSHETIIADDMFAMLVLLLLVVIKRCF